MKKTMFLLGGLAISLATTAQVQTPQLSPKAEIEQTVGLTEFKVEYSRPSLRGRNMHKEIIPFDQAWRFGANKNSTLSFDTPINFGGIDVKAGTYAIYAVPGEKEWKISLYNETDNWGLPEKWDASKVVAEVMVPVKTVKPSCETLTISFDNLNVNDFELTIAWENTMLPIIVKLPTSELTMASIKETMKGNPSERDYYNAASYLLSAEKDLENALNYMSQAIEMNEDAPFYYIRKKALILGAMGKNEAAIEVAKVSLEMAREAGSEEYVRKNKESIIEWSK
jgi:tetratricopeptide (TPR) repeat protein